MISIILPIRNEFKFISKTLDSILNQDYSIGPLEIIIADGMSKDGTRDVINKYQKKYTNILLIDNPGKIVPTGFNLALSKAKGKVIIRIDGHSKINSDFINNCIKTLRETDADCVGGVTKHIADGMVGITISIAQSSKFGVGGVAFRENVAKKGKYVDTLAFGAYKREVFEKIGGYDEELIRNQDDEFNLRLIQSDGKIWLDPSIKSIYYPRNSLNKLFKQYFRYGFYKVRVMQKRQDFASWRHLVPGIFIFFLLFSIILCPVFPFLFYLIFGSYLSANLIASLFSSGKNSYASPCQFIILLTLLPSIFFTLHFSYGLGFLFGLMKFWNKWNDMEVKDFHFNKDQFTNKLIDIK